MENPNCKFILIIKYLFFKIHNDTVQKLKNFDVYKKLYNLRKDSLINSKFVKLTRVAWYSTFYEKMFRETLLKTDILENFVF